MGVKLVRLLAPLVVISHRKCSNLYRNLINSKEKKLCIAVFFSHETRCEMEYLLYKLTANSSGVTLSMSNTTASKLLAESKLRPSRDSELLLSCKHRRKTVRQERERTTGHKIRDDISFTYKIHMDKESWPVALFLWTFNQFNYHCPF